MNTDIVNITEKYSTVLEGRNKKIITTTDGYKSISGTEIEGIITSINSGVDPEEVAAANNISTDTLFRILKGDSRSAAPVLSKKRYAIVDIDYGILYNNQVGANLDAFNRPIALLIDKDSIPNNLPDITSKLDGTKYTSFPYSSSQIPDYNSSYPVTQVRQVNKGVKEVSYPVGVTAIKLHRVKVVVEINTEATTTDNRIILTSADSIYNLVKVHRVINADFSISVPVHFAKGGDDDEILYDMTYSKLLDSINSQGENHDIFTKDLSDKQDIGVFLGDTSGMSNYDNIAKSTSPDNHSKLYIERDLKNLFENLSIIMGLESDSHRDRDEKDKDIEVLQIWSKIKNHIPTSNDKPQSVIDEYIKSTCETSIAAILTDTHYEFITDVKDTVDGIRPTNIDDLNKYIFTRYTEYDNYNSFWNFFKEDDHNLDEIFYDDDAYDHKESIQRSSAPDKHHYIDYAIRDLDAYKTHNRFNTGRVMSDKNGFVMSITSPSSIYPDTDTGKEQLDDDHNQVTDKISTTTPDANIEWELAQSYASDKIILGPLYAIDGTEVEVFTGHLDEPINVFLGVVDPYGHVVSSRNKDFHTGHNELAMWEHHTTAHNNCIFISSTYRTRIKGDIKYVKLIVYGSYEDGLTTDWANSIMAESYYPNTHTKTDDIDFPFTFTEVDSRSLSQYTLDNYFGGDLRDADNDDHPYFQHIQDVERTLELLRGDRQEYISRLKKLRYIKVGPGIVGNKTDDYGPSRDNYHDQDNKVFRVIHLPYKCESLDKQAFYKLYTEVDAVLPTSSLMSSTKNSLEKDRVNKTFELLKTARAVNWYLLETLPKTTINYDTTMNQNVNGVAYVNQLAYDMFTEEGSILPQDILFPDIYKQLFVVHELDDDLKKLAVKLVDEDNTELPEMHKFYDNLLRDFIAPLREILHFENYADPFNFELNGSLYKNYTYLDRYFLFYKGQTSDPNAPHFHDIAVYMKRREAGDYPDEDNIEFLVPDIDIDKIGGEVKDMPVPVMVENDWVQHPEEYGM